MSDRIKAWLEDVYPIEEPVKASNSDSGSGSRVMMVLVRHLKQKAGKFRESGAKTAQEPSPGQDVQIVDWCLVEDATQTDPCPWGVYAMYAGPVGEDLAEDSRGDEVVEKEEEYEISPIKKAKTAPT